jgi:NAD-dependent SIR2 family protein deacetylase
MSKNVFVLGAGASAAAGVPLMGQFLDRAHDLLQANETGDAKAAFERLFEAINILPQVHSKATLDIDNVESVFSALEMASIIGVFGDYDAAKILTLDTAMRVVIAATVEKTMLLPTKNGQVVPPRPYYEFASMLHRMRAGFPRHDASVITFNYDLAVDYALNFVGLPVHYAVGDDDSPDGMPLLKLHGSLNWGLCTQCRAIVPWRLHKYLANRGWHNSDLAKSVRLALTSQMGKLLHHDQPVHPSPVIVPPTWGKTSQHLNLSQVWNRAARELQSAENIFVIGYSLPPSDAFFKYLYALATVGHARIRRFWVFNPDRSVEGRFRELLGPAVQSRFKFFADTFEVAISTIKAEFRSEA